jgi:hypothetical protein
MLATSVSPVGSAAGDIVTYILGFGPLGVGVVLFALGYIVPKATMSDAVNRSRNDLIEENKRLIEEKRKAEEQRDAALKIAQEQIVPLLTTFVSTTSTLLPLLQDVVAMREELRRGTHGGRG